MEPMVLAALIAFVLIVIGFVFYYKKRWFDIKYCKYRAAYEKYRSSIVLKGYAYEKYVSEFKDRNEFSFKFWRSGFYEGREKEAVNSVVSLLENHPQLAHKYFSQENFRFDEYNQMLNEYNQTQDELEEIPVEVSDKTDKKVCSFEDLLLLGESKKSTLIEKIKQYIETGVKGKKIAFMILALRQLGYLPTATSNRQLFLAIRGYFKADIGSDKGIYAYLEDKVYTQFESDIDSLKNSFNVG